jgi:hypothetical protein
MFYGATIGVVGHLIAGQYRVLARFSARIRGICKGEIMNQVFGDKKPQVLSDSAETADLSARQVWVKPVLERLSLQDALGGPSGATDGVGMGS